MFVTDITNCYGSVNPQAFDWVFSFKGTEYETEHVNPIAKNIQKYLRAFQQGRNIGIPQGSAIFDFVGEIILGYSDLLLHEAIQREGITAPYEIIRYRDDYRIFCNDKDELEKISYILQHVLERLNFRMNSKKTKLVIVLSLTRSSLINLHTSTIHLSSTRKDVILIVLRSICFTSLCSLVNIPIVVLSKPCSLT